MIKVPHHLAIIMDGNRRWARQRGLPSVSGHREGSETLKNIARHASERDVRWLTAFAFSFENWSRPKPEIEGLFSLLRCFLENDIGELNEQNVKLRVEPDAGARLWRASGDYFCDASAGHRGRNWNSGSR